MSEHKHNPVAIAAKEGKIQPKKQRMSDRQRKALMVAKIEKATGIGKIRALLGGGYF